MAERLRRTLTPIPLLLVLVVASLAVRAAWIGQPCRSPCRAPAAHLLVFDEAYYVNAARVIAGVAPPTGEHYAGAPAGEDPNAEHPQLVKLTIAGSIELFGDGPLAWRVGSLIAGTLAMLGLYALVRAAGGGEWLGLGAAALMAADNLLVLHGRIGTLDIYAAAAMIWSVALYLRGRPVAAGAVLAVGACCKLVAPYVLLVLAVLEALRWRTGPGPGVGSARALGRLSACAGVAAAGALALLAVLDRIAPPYDPVAGKLVSGGPLGHLGHMLRYAADQSSPHGPIGIASYPWQWLVDLKPIVYLNIDPSRPAPGLHRIHPPVHFVGVISPPILLLGLAGLAVMAWRWLRGKALPGAETPSVALAWFLGTYLPFVLLSLVWSRTSYLYYMVVVMPGLYLAAALAAGWLVRRHRRWLALWVVAVLTAAIALYPLTPLP